MAEGPDLELAPASRELLTFGSITTMAEVYELLVANPTVPVYKYGLLDENMNVLRVGRSEDD